MHRLDEDGPSWWEDACCDEDDGGSHYHCARCGAVCSMMGHDAAACELARKQGRDRPTVTDTSPPFVENPQAWEAERRKTILPTGSSGNQIITTSPEMPLAEFLRLFLLDDDLAVRFVRQVHDLRCHVTIQYRPDGNLDIAIGVEEAV